VTAELCVNPVAPNIIGRMPTIATRAGAHWPARMGALT
jgi:hypothetical protein